MSMRCELHGKSVQLSSVALHIIDAKCRVETGSPDPTRNVSETADAFLVYTSLNFTWRKSFSLSYPGAVIIFIIYSAAKVQGTRKGEVKSKYSREYNLQQSCSRREFNVNVIIWKMDYY